MPSLLRDRLERLELVFRMGGVAVDHHVPGAAYVVERFFYAGRILVLLVGDEDGDRRVPGVVGIAVRGDVDAALARRLDHLYDGGGLAPDADRPELDVGDLDGQARLLADVDRFLEGIERAVRFVPDVAHVEAAVPGGRFRELDELPGLAVAAGSRTRARSTARSRLRSSPARRVPPFARSRRCARGAYSPLPSRHAARSHGRPSPARSPRTGSSGAPRDTPQSARETSRPLLPPVS